jgi:predicted AAA+ superfamily ATPase
VYPRLIERRLKESLSDTRVVLLSGPRQSGKTTLDTAHNDPVGFIQGLDRIALSSMKSSEFLRSY